jgi:putative transposase
MASSPKTKEINHPIKVKNTLLTSQLLLHFFMEPTYRPEFLTATITHWHHLMSDDKCKRIILEALAWLSANGRCQINGFVIMPNHIHLIWKITDGLSRFEVQGALLSYTAHAFQKYLKRARSVQLSKYKVLEVDRKYQFWERDSRVKECWSQAFILQKFNYLHNNPCQPKWNLARAPADYYWSSAEFYETGISRFPWLVHYLS